FRRTLVQHGDAARIRTGERIAEYEARNPSGVALHVDQRLHGGSCNGDEVTGCSKSGLREHRLEIVDQRVDGVSRANLLRASEAALIVAQGAETLAQCGKNAVPAVERSAHLMKQHNRWTVAGDLEMDARSVCVEPRQ